VRKRRNKMIFNYEGWKKKASSPSLGGKFGNLTFLSLIFPLPKGKCWARFKCDCGKTTVKNLYYVKSGNTRSCGCLYKGTGPTQWTDEQWRNRLKNLPKDAKGCILWDGYTNPKGYGQAGYKGKVMLSHRLAYHLFKDPVPTTKLVCHSCDNPSCVNPDHLFLGSPSQNSADMVSKGRSIRGEKNPHSRLTWEKVKKIRTIPRSHLSRDVASEYGVSEETIRLIRKGTTWKEKEQAND